MRRYRNVSLRLPPTLLAELEGQRDRFPQASLTAVVQHHLEKQLEALPKDSGPLLWRRQNRQVERSFFSLRPQLVDELERVGGVYGVNICDVALNLLHAGLNPPTHLAA